jgi:AAA domain
VAKNDVDYLKIARQRVHRPSQVTHFPKLLVYSRNKKGKTTFGLSAGIDATICLDPEHGTDSMKKRDPHVWPIERWEDVQDFWGAIRTHKLSPAELGTGKPKEPFGWVSCDGLTKINNMALKYIGRQAELRDLDRRPGMVDRRDYLKSGELMKDFINNLFSLRMGVVFTAQERMISDGAFDDDEDAEEADVYYVPDLPAGVRGTINSVVDVIGRLYVVEVETKDGPRKQRRLQIGINNAYDTGYRSEYSLPDMLKNPTVPKLVQLMQTGQVA